MPLGGTDLFFDEIEVVEQPFPGRRDPAVRRYRRLQQLAHVDQDDFVLGQPGQQLVRRAPSGQLVRCRERLAMLRHLIGAEQRQAQRRLCVG